MGKLVDMSEARTGSDLYNSRARGHWSEAAACLGKDPEMFFDKSDLGIKIAKKVCSLCEVQNECLSHALTLRSVRGVWGGKSADEIRSIKRRAKRSKI